VKSINTLKDNVTLAEGSNVTITPGNNTLTISSVGLALPFSATTSSSSPLLALTNTGTGRGGSFRINNTASSNTAFYATTNGTGQAGYFSIDNASSTANAVEGYVTSGNASGVYGKSYSNGFGVTGLSTDNGGTGVYGESNGLSSNGVYGNSNSGTGIRGGTITGVGVYGLSTSGTGLRGESGSASGVYGSSTSSYGVQGFNTNSGSRGILGTVTSGVFGASSVANGVYGTTTASNASGVYGENMVGGIGVAGRATGTGSRAMYCDGRFFMFNGVFEASPTSTLWTTNKPATVKLSEGSQVKLFAEEAAEVYFNDYGEGQLTNGRTHIELDSKFLQTVTINQAHPVKVFFGLDDDCKGVFVRNKNATGFDVVELQGGTSNARFTYRVVCKRKYYEGERLATEEQDIQYNKNMLETAWPEVIAKQKADEERTKAMEARHGLERGMMKATPVWK
jgi:hypothetical protein